MKGLYWPAQIASLARDRNTQIFGHQRRAHWPLGICGPFSLYPKWKGRSPSARNRRVADILSNLLALPVHYWHNGEALYVKIGLSQDEYDAILRSEYQRDTAGPKD